MEWLRILAYLGLGFVLLDKGAVWLVGGGGRLARRMGVSAMVVGLTVVAWGTSAPEVVVSAVAAWHGSPSISLGNVLGSNVANIGLVLGVCGLIQPQILRSRLAPREWLWLFGSLGALWLCCWDRSITRLDAGLLLLLFAAYTLQLWFSAREEPQGEAPGSRDRHPVIHVLMGMVAIAFGAELVTRGAVEGAQELGIQKRVIGLTVIAVGTSLPELAAGVRSAMRRETEITLGNVLGSNVFNVLAVIGLVGLIQPFEVAAGPPDGTERASELGTTFDSVLRLDLPLVLVFSIAVVLMPFVRYRGPGRRKALVLLVAYLVYTWWLYATGQVGG